MYNGKYISTDFVIDKILKDYSWNMSLDRMEIADDIFDAIDLIGVPIAFIERVTNGEGDNPEIISIEDYAAELPCDLHLIKGVRTHDFKVALIEDTSVFKPQEGASNDSTEGYSDRLVYHVNDSFIYTNFEEGDIEITYVAFPTDKNGVPMIPDNTRYINGVVSYVAERIGFREWWKGKLEDKKYEYLVRERAFYIPSAAGAMNTPSYDKAEGMKNQLNRMMQSTNHHAYGFKYLNSEEVLKVHK